MLELESPYRYATPDDAGAMAELVNIAGEGLPLYLWTQMAAEGESPWELGRNRARRDTGGFSYRNTLVCETPGGIAACLIGYPLAVEPEAIDNDVPAMFMPLLELEALAAATWYVNVLATHEAYRARGHATALLSLAERLAVDLGREGMSIIVSDANAAARRLYERLGYRERATRPMVKENWQNDGSHWVLLLKTLDRSG